MPGVGAQGGDMTTAIRAGLDAHGGGVLPSASRSVIFASNGTDFERAAADAARALRDTANAARVAVSERR
jgi:orotidine-5'-phosphate decarboxylase